MPVALVSREVELASENDPTLKFVRQAVLTGDWSVLQGTTYKKLKDEFWIIGQVVMQGTRIVIPEFLWKCTIMLAHEGHQELTSKWKNLYVHVIPAKSWIPKLSQNRLDRPSYLNLRGKTFQLIFLK